MKFIPLCSKRALARAYVLAERTTKLLKATGLKARTVALGDKDSTFIHVTPQRALALSMVWRVKHTVTVSQNDFWPYNDGQDTRSVAIDDRLVVIVGRTGKLCIIYKNDKGVWGSRAQGGDGNPVAQADIVLPPSGYYFGLVAPSTNAQHTLLVVATSNTPYNNADGTLGQLSFSSGAWQFSESVSLPAPSLPAPRSAYIVGELGYVNGTRHVKAFRAVDGAWAPVLEVDGSAEFSVWMYVNELSGSRQPPFCWTSLRWQTNTISETALYEFIDGAYREVYRAVQGDGKTHIHEISKSGTTALGYINPSALAEIGVVSKGPSGWVEVARYTQLPPEDPLYTNNMHMSDDGRTVVFRPDSQVGFAVFSSVSGSWQEVTASFGGANNYWDFANISSDGRTVILAGHYADGWGRRRVYSYALGSWQFVTESVGGQMTPFLMNNLAISPDGRTFAFSLQSAQEAELWSCVTGTWVKYPDTNAIGAVLQMSHPVPAFSADGLLVGYKGLWWRLRQSILPQTNPAETVEERRARHYTTEDSVTGDNVYALDRNGVVVTQTRQPDMTFKPKDWFLANIKRKAVFEAADPSVVKSLGVNSTTSYLLSNEHNILVMEGGSPSGNVNDYRILLLQRG